MADLATIEDRIAALESKVDQLLSTDSVPAGHKDWRKTVGRFAGDELMKEIDAEGSKLRAANGKVGGQ